MKNANTVAKPVVVSANIDVLVDAILTVARGEVAAVKTGAVISAQISAFYVATNGNDAAFVEAFGNGLLGKKNIAGSIKTAVDLKSARMSAETKKKVSSIVKARLSEARALREAKGFPAVGESVQTALRRYRKPAAPAATVGREIVGVSIADNASLDDIADALSIWIAKHGAATAGLVEKLKDFLPIIKRNVRKAV